MRGLIARVRSFWRGLRRPEQLSAEMEEEMRFHIEMEAERLVRERGLAPEEAKRQAAIAFGGVEIRKEEGRDVRGLTRITGTSLDFKLGLRMLAKYPLLALVGGVSITVAVALAVSWFQFSKNLVSPTLPFEDAGRIVRVQNWDLTRADDESRSLHDFAMWQDELTSIDELSAVSGARYTLSTEDGRSSTINGARITASTFRVLGVAPVLGRPFVAADFDPGAPSAVVIGYDVWQRLFDGDRDVLGATVRLGESTGTVVGVMPEGFGFPAVQELWLPLRENALDYAQGEGPGIFIFGRLAPGFTREEAQAELTAIGLRAAASSPATNEHLRPRVGPLVDMGAEGTFAAAANFVFVLLLIIICANVAILVFARTATREGELAIRSALGASRRRLVIQLIAETLVLTTVAALAGLVIARLALDRGMALFWQVQQSKPPYWWSNDVSVATVLYIAALAVVGATIAGGIPALRATGRRVRPALSRLGTGGSRLKFGRMSTAVIVLQVALCVILLPIVMVRAKSALVDRVESTGFPADEFLSGRLSREAETPLTSMPDAAREAFRARTAELQEEVRQRLASEPGISAVAFANRIPGMNHPGESLQIEGSAVSPDSAVNGYARVLSVGPSFFDAMDAPIIAGRGFRPADTESEVDVAIVDQSFVEQVLGGRNPVGRWLSYPSRSGEDGERRYEIVGVVQDLGMNAFGPGGYQDLEQTAPAGYVGVYHPLRPGEAVSLQMFLRTNTPNARALVPRIQSIVTSLDPSLRVDDLMTVDELWRPAHQGERLLTWMMALVVLLVVGLAAAGIYALMSFVVSQRTREIGIRAALGADPRRIILTIFSRALLQIGFGVLLGALVLGFTIVKAADGIGLVVGVAALMTGVGLLACLPPARRALRIQPTEAIRAE